MTGNSLTVGTVTSAEGGMEPQRPCKERRGKGLGRGRGGGRVSGRDIDGQPGLGVHPPRPLGMLPAPAAGDSTLSRPCTWDLTLTPHPPVNGNVKST